MTEDKDIWRAAQLMIRQHGDRAATEAAMRADRLLDEGDVDGQMIWRRILRAIEQLDADKPPSDSSVH